MRKALFTPITVLFVVIVSLALGEAMVRVLAPQDMLGSWSVYGPRGLLVNTPYGTGRHRLGQREVEYHFNSLHQRGTVEPRSDAARVLVLGDSFTFGWLLQENDTYVAQLQRATDAAVGGGRIQFLNAGTGGWGTADMLAYLEALGSRIRPAMVLVFVNFDDFNRALIRGLYRLGDSGGLDALDLSANRSTLKILLEGTPGYGWLRDHSQLFQLIRNLAVSKGAVVRFIPAEQPPDDLYNDPRLRALASALFGRMEQWCADNGARLVVTTTGWPTVNYPWLAETLEALSIDHVDLAPAVAGILGNDLDAYIIAGDGHPNEKGAALIAAAAWVELRNRIEALAQ
ncbi:MAG TPA: GDSL-type esterase/lipase family protein [Azospirillaceae bacterium]|nr:GDSL-type esterase/lipase family protein [Azospirillaceae bacterium]